MAEKKEQTLEEFFVGAPLYINIPLAARPRKSDGRINLPKVIRRYCFNTLCQADLQWTLDEPMGTAESTGENSLEGRRYRCPNCRSHLNVWFYWQAVDDAVIAVKVGQYPPLDLRLPKDLETALGEYSAGLWKKGMRARHHGHGIGALAYFRRVVEGATGKLLGLLADSMEAGGEPAAEVKAVRDLISAKMPFDKKMEHAARMIPRSLRPGGANPFQTMFDFLSGGLHAESDEDCCALVDALADSMLLIVARLSQHIEAEKAYGEAVREVERLRTKQEDR